VDSLTVGQNRRLSASVGGTARRLPRHDASAVTATRIRSSTRPT